MENVEILDTEHHYSKHLLGEIVFIQLQNTINKRTDIEKSSDIYYNIRTRFINIQLDLLREDEGNSQKIYIRSISQTKYFRF